MLIGLKTNGALASETCLLQNLDNKKAKKTLCRSVIPILLHLPTNIDGTKKIQNFKIITNQLNTLLMQYTVLFYVTLSQTYFCSVQNIMYSLFIFYIPLDPQM